jgi:hypothetical protein
MYSVQKKVNRTGFCLLFEEKEESLESTYKGESLKAGRG